MLQLHRWNLYPQKIQTMVVIQEQNIPKEVLMHWKILQIFLVRSM